MLSIEKKPRFLFFGEETFKITDYGVEGFKDPFEPTNKPYIIHENSGGGIRGTLSVVAGYIHENVAKTPYSNANVKARWGCSTGAIVEAMLANGASYRELLDFYVYDGPAVFDEQFGGAIVHSSAYSAKNLEKILKKLFGNITMKELYEKSGVELYIITYDATMKKTVVITHDDYYGEDTSYFPVWVAVRASMSAPYYFGTFFWNDPVLKMERGFLDGGITGFNMSAELAYEHAIRDQGIDTNDIHILSIGTGYCNGNVQADKIAKKLKGLFAPAKLIRELQITMYALMNAQCNFANRKLNTYKKEGKLSYQGWNVPLLKDLEDMDETSNIDNLFNIVVNMYK